jgi:hypothetical protein
MLEPKQNTSILISFIFTLTYHLIYLLVKKFRILLLLIKTNIFINKPNINILINIDKINNNILISYICVANTSKSN